MEIVPVLRGLMKNRRLLKETISLGDLSPLELFVTEIRRTAWFMDGDIDGRARS